MARKAPAGGHRENGQALDKLKSVYEFMTRHDLESVELDQEGAHLKLVRRRAAAPVPVPVPMPSAAAAAAAPLPTAPAAPEIPAGGQTIKAPMMGIFYRASSPSSPPFVKEGESVKPGHVLCMIEAMKVFNEVKAEYPCTILKTL
ncbi:MAG: acetyl-CoA carboxylase, biotin carboxyl carrier protein, partial [Elusimicrobia bacterium]|nr:acetyl-CoA carboxylase, biotin carboxyl carrier protein [Elusimicrobiota bacterium]